MLDVGPDRFDHRVKFIGAIDLARYAVGLTRHEVVDFSKVMQPIDPLGVAVELQEHHAGAVLFPREQDEVVGAEVEHGAGSKEREWRFLPPHGQLR